MSTPRYLRALAGAAAVALTVSGIGRAEALDLRNVLTGYTLTSWSQKDGLPAGTVWATAQDHDGYLWVGTDSGLVRFDGSRFSTWASLGSTPLPKAAVRVLLVSRGGDLWVGFGKGGGVTRIRQGDVQRYRQNGDLEAENVTAIAEDQNGVIWAGGGRGLFKLSAGTWTVVAANPPLKEVSSLHVDRQQLLVGTSTGIFRLKSEDDRFEKSENLDDGPRAIVTGADGALYVTDAVRGFRAIGDNPTSILLHNSRGRGSQLLYDQQDNLWVGTIGQGLWRLRRDASVRGYLFERASASTGLLSDGVFSLTEDRDGNIWAGTTEGLCRFVRQRISQITDLGLVRSVVTAPNGDVWVGTTDELIAFPGGSTTPSPLRMPLKGGRFRAIHIDNHGTTWMATNRFLAKVSGTGLRVVSGAEGLHSIDWLTSDAHGGLWIYDLEKGLAYWDRGHLSFPRLSPVLTDGLPVASYTDSASRVWIGLDDGRVILLEAHKRPRVFGAADGLHGGAYHTISEDDEHQIWLGGPDGISYYDGVRFVTVSARDPFIGDVSAILDDGRGSLWVGTPAGIGRIARDELARAAEDATYELRYARYDRYDGLAGMPMVSYGHSRRAIRARDGRLWFVTGRGLTVIDPEQMKGRRRLAPARIDRIVADAVAVPNRGPDVRLPPRTRKIEIEYTALDLTSSTTKFRYRLDGLDENWVDGSPPGSAQYTNLPPRSYQFHVVAWDEENGWTPETILAFSIQPMFYETAVFPALCAASLALGVWLVWFLHVRRIRRSFSLVIAERARLGREIHDTLLQGLVGMALQLDVIASDPAIRSLSTSEQLTRLRLRIEGYIRDARQSIWNLRRQGTSDDFAEALRRDAVEIASGGGLTLSFIVTGVPFACPRRVQEELIRIAHEAVVNAARHAFASYLRIDLTYRPASLTLTVCDDGCGFEPQSAMVDSLHYGLLGIRERAKLVAGELRIVSAPGAGTSIEVVIPRRRRRAAPG